MDPGMDVLQNEAHDDFAAQIQERQNVRLDVVGQTKGSAGPKKTKKQ